MSNEALNGNKKEFIKLYGKETKELMAFYDALSPRSHKEKMAILNKYMNEEMINKEPLSLLEWLDDFIYESSEKVEDAEPEDEPLAQDKVEVRKVKEEKVEVKKVEEVTLKEDTLDHVIPLPHIVSNDPTFAVQISNTGIFSRMEKPPVETKPVEVERLFAMRVTKN